MPKVSIIVPVYNVEKYLHSCLDSILAQTFTDFEAVLVDDGSTDNSGKVCDEYAAKDSRFVVVHKQNEGVAKARITGFEHSKGELISFIDSDDYVSADYLEKLSLPLLKGGADLVSCDYYLVEGNTIKESIGTLTGTWEKEQIRKDFIANHYFYDKLTQGYGMTPFLWTKLVRRKYVFDSLLQGEGMWYAEDQIAVFHILQRCKKMVLIPNRLYFYIQHEGQAIKKYDMSLWDNLIILMEKYKELDKENISEEGRRIRTWFHLNYTIKQKMVPSLITRNVFCKHLSQVRNHPYMKEFFRPIDINLNYKVHYKSRIQYFLLKYRFYSLLYFFMHHK